VQLFGDGLHPHEFLSPCGLLQSLQSTLLHEQVLKPRHLQDEQSARTKASVCQEASAQLTRSSGCSFGSYAFLARSSARSSLVDIAHGSQIFPSDANRR
jgi:hypothetical protein